MDMRLQLIPLRSTDVDAARPSAPSSAILTRTRGLSSKSPVDLAPSVSGGALEGGPSMVDAVAGAVW